MTFVATPSVPRLELAGTAVTGPIQRSLPVRVVSRLGGTALRVLVVLVGLVWLFRRVGLAVASLRSSADNSASGWWTVFARPSQLTLANYGRLLGNADFTHSLVNTILTTVPSTVLVVALGSLGAYALA